MNQFFKSWYLSIISFVFIVGFSLFAFPAHANAEAAITGQVWNQLNNGSAFLLVGLELKYGDNGFKVFEDSTNTEVKDIFGSNGVLSTGAGTYTTIPVKPGSYRIEVNADANSWQDALRNLDAAASGAKCYLSQSLMIFNPFMIPQAFNDCTAAVTKITKAIVQGDDRYIGYTYVTVGQNDTLVTAPPLYVKQLKISPIVTALASWTTSIAGFISKGLELMMNLINSLLFKTKEYVMGGDMSQTWMVMRDISLSLLVLGLLVIAFANVLQVNIETYGLNRMIPKIIIAIVFSFLSWLLFSFFFEFTGVLQSQAYGLMNGHQAAIEYLGHIRLSNPSAEQVGAAFGMFAVAIAIMVVMLISLATLLITMLLRIVVLAFLLATAPIAMILGILPFTQKVYKDWWSNFWKWMFVGPMAVIIIAVGSVLAAPKAASVSSIVATFDPSSLTASDTIIKMLFMAATIYYAGSLAKSWGGKIVNGTISGGKKLWGATGGAAMKLAGAGVAAGVGFGLEQSGISGAYRDTMGALKKRAGDRAEVQGAELRESLGLGKYGKSADLIRARQTAAKVKENKELLEARGKSRGELRGIAAGGSSTEEKMAAYELLAGQGGIDKSEEALKSMAATYGDQGRQKALSLLGQDRKKSPVIGTGEGAVDQADRVSAAFGLNEEERKAFDGQNIMRGTTSSEQAEMSTDTYKNPDYTSGFHMDEKTISNLADEKVNALMGDAGQSEAITTAIGRQSESFAKAIKENNTELAHSIAREIKLAGGTTTGMSGLTDAQAATFVKSGRLSRPTQSSAPAGNEWSGL